VVGTRRRRARGRSRLAGVRRSRGRRPGRPLLLATPSPRRRTRARFARQPPLRRTRRSLLARFRRLPLRSPFLRRSLLLGSFLRRHRPRLRVRRARRRRLGRARPTRPEPGRLRRRHCLGRHRSPAPIARQDRGLGRVGRAQIVASHRARQPSLHRLPVRRRRLRPARAAVNPPWRRGPLSRHLPHGRARVVRCRRRHGRPAVPLVPARRSRLQVRPPLAIPASLSRRCRRRRRFRPSWAMPGPRSRHCLRGRRPRHRRRSPGTSAKPFLLSRAAARPPCRRGRPSRRLRRGPVRADRRSRPGRRPPFCRLPRRGPRPLSLCRPASVGRRPLPGAPGFGGSLPGGWGPRSVSCWGSGSSVEPLPGP
jgi:hypothetical protein